jgi:hypothetical protein
MKEKMENVPKNKRVRKILVEDKSHKIIFYSQMTKISLKKEIKIDSEVKLIYNMIIHRIKKIRIKIKYSINNKKKYSDLSNCTEAIERSYKKMRKLQ